MTSLSLMTGTRVGRRATTHIPNRDYWCEYARRWIWIKSEWDLSVNPNEKTALNDMLATCKAD
ncbi:MAG: hypothetical protein M3Q62_03875 [Actinomycetota bacterium]|nr:hypothetical protein [Rubrobacteraceae bacterium]MBA3636824.1 hypothetical protein [Rubrobacteraceae bacterium]MDQ3182680.1 hypothetical protein [Actinomycetota bacterium]MDQ3498394.1 hypothetical protein [Actinomycetota bacterium]